MNKTHKRKMAAPIIITVLFVALFAGYAAVYLLVDEIPLIAKIAGGGSMIALAVGMIVVLSSRIKEIKGGEEDDLSNY